MPVNSAKNSYSGLTGVASTDLGFGAGDMLRNQLEGETEEQKRLRLLRQQMQAAVNPGTMSTASQALFGGIGGYSGRGA